jgi:hypothetical protein
LVKLWENKLDEKSFPRVEENEDDTKFGSLAV